MANLAQIQSIAQGQFFVKDSLGNLTELKVGDTVSLNDTIVAASSNTDLSKIEILFDTNELITLSQGEQLLDATLLASTFGNEELAFDKQEVDETLNAWNNAQDGDETDMETAAGDVTEQATNAGDERAADGGALRSKFNSRDGDATDIVSDLREASWTGGIERIIEDSENMLLEDPLPVVYTIEDSENMLLEQPLPVVYTIIEGIDVVNEGDSANYVVKLQDAAGNPVIATQDTIIYVRYTNKTTQDGDTQYNNENIIEVVIKAGTSQTEFTINTNDDYLADNGEIYNVSITGNNSIEFDMRTGDVAGNKTNVDTTILDNSNPLSPDGEDGGYGSEDIVFAIIEGTTTVNEGDTAQYVVKLVDKDGNPVTVTKDTEVTIKYTNKTTQDGDTEYNNNDTIKITIKAGENSSDDFDVYTIDDYLADNGEKFNLEITNVDDQGQFEKVNIGDINDDKINVDTTILDNSNPTKPGGEDGGYGSEDTVFAIITGTQTIKEGDISIDYTVKLVDKDGNTVTVTKDTDITIKFEGTGDKQATLDDIKQFLDLNNSPISITTDGKITVTIPSGESQITFKAETQDDFYADNNEQYKLTITDVAKTGEFEKVEYDNYPSTILNNPTNNVTTTIIDNTTDKPNDPSTIEKNQENVILKIVAADKYGNPIKGTDGNYLTQNEVPEGSDVYYVVLAFKPDTTTFNDSTKLPIQEGKVEVETSNKTASGVNSQTKDDGTEDYISKKEIVELGKPISVKTLDDWKSDNNEQFKIKITDKPYQHPSTPVYENVVTDKDSVTTTIKDNTNPNTETDVESVKIVLVAVDSLTTKISDITGADGKLIIDNTNGTAEGGKLYYIAVAVDKDGKPLATQGGDVTINYGTTSTTSDKDATAGVDYDNTTKVKVGVVFKVKTKDDYYAEGDENFTVKITDKSYEHPTTGAVYENVVTNTDTVTSTITDNVPVKNHQVDNIGGIDGTVYGKEDTVYVKIEGNPTVVEGGEVEYTVKLVDSTGKEVKVTSDTKVTVTFGTNNSVSDGEVELKGTPNNNPLENGENITITIPKNGNSASFTIKTKDDFTADNNETFNLKITDVDSKEFENIVYDDKNGINTTIKDGVTLGDPVGTKVYEDGLNYFSDKTENSLTNSLGITNPNNDAYTVSFDKSITTSTEKSNGKIITYSYNESGTVLTAKRTDGKTVFTVELKKDASGKDVYDFKLIEAMDHSYGNNGKNDFDLPFNFNVTSNGTTSDNKTFNVTVVDSVPNAKDKTVTTNEDTATTIRLSNDAFKDNGTIKINGSDVAKDNSIAIYEKGDTTKQIGTLKNNGDGTVEFTPSPDYSNYDFTKSPQFTYTVTDFDGDEATATVRVNVKPVADAPTIFVKNVETTEDAGNTQEGTNKVALELKVPSLSKDQTDENNATGDSPERNGEITLKFTNGDSLVSKAEGKNIPNTGAKLFYIKDGESEPREIDNFLINVNKNLKIVIVETSGSTTPDTKYHYDGLNPTAGINEKVVYLTQKEYESLKIQHAEDNDTDIVINISTRSYEVNDSGEPLSNSQANNQGKTDSKTMTVIIKPITDNIELKWVGQDEIGTISSDGKTFVFNDIKEDESIDLRNLLSNTSGALNGEGGTKADLDGSEKRTYTISGIPAGTVVTLDGQTAIANTKGVATLVLDTDNNQKLDHDSFKMQFPNGYSGGTVEGKITLSVYDNGVESRQRDKTDYGFKDANGKPLLGVKQAEVNFKVNVTPVADEATLKVGQVVGYEDAGRNTDKNVQDKDGTIKHPGNGIKLPIEVTSTDKDGSETFTVTIKDIPNGGAIFVKDPVTKQDILVAYDKNGIPTLEVWKDGKVDGAYTGTTIKAGTGTITIEKYDNVNPPKFIPPHNAHGDFKLSVDAKTVDTVKIDGEANSYYKTDTQEVATNKDIVVVVKDVADSVVGNDYNKLDLVATDADDKVVGTHKKYNAIVNEDDNGGKISLNSIFTEFTDATKLSSYDKESEDLTIILKSLPKGVELEGNVTLINGQYIFKADDISGIKIVTPPNYSGELNFDITYITTEKGEANNPSKTHNSTQETNKISIFVKPTIDAQFDSQTTKAEDSEIVDGGNSYYKVDLGISHQNGDNDETLESVTIKAPEANSGYKLFIIDGNTKTEITSDYTLKTTELNKVYVEVKENQHGSFDIKGTYTVKDSQYAGKDVNYETKETKDFTHKLTITPVTDTPTITVETGTQTHINVNAEKNTEIKIPVKVSSVDKDGSENITKIVISGVPQGVTVDGLGFEKLFDENGNSINVSLHNGIYTITGHGLNSDSFKDIVFNVGANADFEHRDITITAFTKDAEGSKEEQTSTKITLDKIHNGTGTGEGPTLGIEIKDTNFTATEDTQFNFLDVFKVVVTDGGRDGRTELNFKIDVGSNATLKGLDAYKNTDGSYTIKGNRADIESVLANLKVVPNKDYNDNHTTDKSTLDITVTIDGKTPVIAKVPVVPVTDAMSIKVEATPTDLAGIVENKPVDLKITLINSVDGKHTEEIKSITIKVTETWKDNAIGEVTEKGLLTDTRGNYKINENLDGTYTITKKDGTSFDFTEIKDLQYTPTTNRNGDVSFDVIVNHKEIDGKATMDTLEDGSRNAIGSKVITVKPVVSSEIKVGNVQDGVEDEKMASIELNVVKADPSEKFESVLIKVASGVAIYYNEGKSLAMNLGDGSWLVPVNSDGTLPQIFFKGNEHFGGEIKFDAIINVKDGDSKVSSELIKGSVTITEVVDGVTIDPTKTGIDKNAFEWTSLNLNANMKDVDGSEKMYLTLEGLNSSAQFRVVDKDGNLKEVNSTYDEVTGKWSVEGVAYDDINNLQITSDKSTKVKVEAWTKNGEDLSQKVSGEFDLAYKQSAVKDGILTLGKEVNIDFSKIANGDIQGVSKIDLGAEGENKLLNLTLDDVLSIGKKDGSGNINLDILGGTDDKVSFAKDNGWKKADSTVTEKIGEDTKTFEIYTNSGDPTVQVKVEQPISDGITN